MADTGTHLFLGDAMSFYASWPSPVVIVSDGAYGVGGFEGDPPTHHGLPVWYAPHIREWSRHSTPQTTLWFWNTEIGWAMVHPLLAREGWEYRNCHIWNKGIGHIAGNANSQTLRKFPVVTEVCVQYVREAKFPLPHGRSLTMKEWLRHEWERAGLPLSATNEACGVRNAATRKYFTQDYMWYYPPVDAFEKLAAYANRYGRIEGRPYFSVDGQRPLTGEEWGRMRAKFTCEHGVTNVWDEPPMHGQERLKDHRNRCVHLNQKPLRLLSCILRASSDPGDVVWEPFGGLCSVAVACHRLGRVCYSAEVSTEYYGLAVRRMEKERAQRTGSIAPLGFPADSPVAAGRMGTLRASSSRKRHPLRTARLFQT